MKKLLFLFLILFIIGGCKKNKPAPPPPPPKTECSVTIYWNVPTTRRSGVELPTTEIESYILIIGEKKEIYKEITIDDPNITSWTLILPAGKYWTYLQTIDTDGLRSAHSRQLPVEC